MVNDELPSIGPLASTRPPVHRCPMEVTSVMGQAWLAPEELRREVGADELRAIFGGRIPDNAPFLGIAGDSRSEDYHSRV